MKLSDKIYYQVNGFFKSGKTIVSAKNKSELFLSRILGTCILVLTISWFSFVSGLGSGIPFRIHIRAILYLIPSVGFIIMFYKGISTSWLFSGLKKYWLVPALTLYTYYVLASIFYRIFFDPYGTVIGIPEGLMLVFYGVIFSIYFRKKASLLLYKGTDIKHLYGNLEIEDRIIFLGYKVFSLVWLIFFLGGFAILEEGRKYRKTSELM